VNRGGRVRAAESKLMDTPARVRTRHQPHANATEAKKAASLVELAVDL